MAHAAAAPRAEAAGMGSAAVARTQPRLRSEPADEALAAPQPDAETAEPTPEPPLQARIDVPSQAGDRDAYQDAGQFDAGRSNFDFEPPFRPRRNKARMWMMAAVVFAIVALAAAGAIIWYGLPDWASIGRPTFAEAEPDLTLDFPANRQDRRTLPNGTEFFGASGTVTNVGRIAHRVPTILIILRDAHDRIVYSWEVVPPKRTLEPGESEMINEAVTDIPKSATSAEIGWKPD
jgi:hypothetical protein